MSFIIEYSLQEEKRSGIKYKDPVQLNSKCIFVDLGRLNGQKTMETKSSDGSVIYSGDLISAPFSGPINEFVDWLHSSKGNFNGVYYFPRSVLVFGSMFNALPLFYTENSNMVVVSDQINNLIPYLKQNSIDGTHFLERVLFNYSLTNRTCVSGIKQIPVNSFLRLEENRFEFVKHTDISDLFQDSPVPSDKCMNDLVDLFNERLEDYLPDHKFNAAFTGGFDGRCIVSSCIRNKKEFTAYSFGTKESADVSVPLDISKKIGIDFQPILIDDNYLSKIYPVSARQMVVESNGLSTIGRAHYHYGSEILSKRSNIMISGNCGSELFRASYQSGMLTTAVLFHWLKVGLPNSLTEFLKIFPEYDFLNKERFSEVYEKLSVELDTKRKMNSHLPLNAQLYYLMWEESLRNYFGGELSMQQKHLIHRSPFLDYRFFKEVQGTMVSGAYYKYRDKNPVRRMQGQLFYANFIKKNNHDLFKLPTGRGYSPSDILSFTGKIKLVYSKFLKSKQTEDSNNDPLFSTLGFKTYYDKFISELVYKINDYVDLRQGISENSMKALFTFSIFFDYLAKEGNSSNKNFKS